MKRMIPEAGSPNLPFHQKSADLFGSAARCIAPNRTPSMKIRHCHDRKPLADQIAMAMAENAGLFESERKASEMAQAANRAK